MCPRVSSPTLCLSRCETFAALEGDWPALLEKFPGNTIFLTWEWQQLWWRLCGEGELHLLAIRADDELVGIAPLIQHNGQWGFAGGAEVADYLDLIAAPENAATVATAVLDYLQSRGGPADFRNLRPDSVGATSLRDEARRRGLAFTLEPEDISPRLELPTDWETYLQSLSKKDRHELRRKLRRLLEAGHVQYGWVTDPTARDVDDFLRLHRESAEAKSTFMTPTMERFFRALVHELTPRGWLRLYFLTIDNVRVASAILFDYRDEFLLYNSGYDPAFSHQAVGLLLKAFTIQEAIAEGRAVFDFLQGDEPYKYDLGGHDVPIFQLRLGFAFANGAVRHESNV